MLTDVLRRWSFHPGHEPPQIPPLLVEAPHMRRQPGEASLEQRHAQRWELVENPFADHAGELRRKDLGHAHVLFEEEGRPARRSVRVTRRTTKVDPSHH